MTTSSEQNKTLHGRPRSWIAADIARFEGGKLAEHWDVLQDEGDPGGIYQRSPMFGDRFLTEATLQLDLNMMADMSW